MSQVQRQPNLTQQPADQKQGAAAAPVATNQTPDAASYAGPCKNTQTREDSEACSQWIAAVAARETAAWEAKHYQVEILGAVGLGISLILSAIAAIQAIRAFRSTKRTEIAQTRAYLFVEAVQVIDGTEIDGARRHVPGAGFAVKNFGSTPAHDVRVWSAITFGPNVDNWAPPEPDMTACATTVFAPQVSQSYVKPVTHDPYGIGTEYCLTRSVIDEIRGGVTCWMLYGRITYKDAFDESRVTNFRYTYAGAWPPLPDTRAMIAPRGNNSN